MTNRATNRATKFVLAAYLVVIHSLLIYLALDKWTSWKSPGDLIDVAAIPAPGEPPANVQVVEPPPVEIPGPELTVPTPTEQPTAQFTPRPGGLIVPVAGVRPDQLVDSFADARGTGRVHDAIDIMAPAGTPVLAAADGEILKFFDSVAGGITIYQASADRRFVYYYAHLQSRATGLKEGENVTQGRTIGYVGDTGNSGAGNYHLHFSVSATTNPRRYWEGTYLNPYPLLRR